ncbi:MAG: hypothetical protein NZ889_00630 [Candidatus Pacearchaeota archaeon]|nr:hypothetical protein [Candidatus Pacearchaeota archaeon]
MNYKPMLAEIGDKHILNSNEYIFEPKLDGTRVLIYKNEKEIKLINRRGKNIISRYPELKNIHKNLMARKCVLDAELIILDKKGKPNFNFLQQREQLKNKTLIEIRSKELPATLFVFDILELNGVSLIKKTVKERKKILEGIIKNSPFIVLCPYAKDGKKLWRKIKKERLEGVIAKKINSTYEQKRSFSWLKIKNFKTTDAVVIGFTKGKSKRKDSFGSLLV